MEFLGHGMLGLGHPAAWAAYSAVMGVGRSTAFALMPVVGACDIAMAAAVLLYPVRGVVLYMAAWGMWTALLRPLAGEPFWEAVERAGNYGVPFALFLLIKGGGWRAWLGGKIPAIWEEGRRRALCRVLQATTVLLLAGHGALGLLVRKPLLSAQYAAIGLPGAAVEPWVGALEIALALAVLWKPGRRLLLAVFVWKLATEMLSPLTGSAIWVFFEHGGSYAAPLALALLVDAGDSGPAVAFSRSTA